ncbi:MAG TPA: rRNA maturation RNase YbeY [Candidatus Paceibacterota bacterium]|nr:rRNA maturation RNase YbeY [Candidatus Paceibacterota bacterium]
MAKTVFYSPNFSVTKLIGSAPPIGGALLLRIKDKVLGRKYQLSLVFTSLSHSQKLNRKYRQKRKPANILSFPISKNEGEIFISPAAWANPKQPKSKSAVTAATTTLFIHGLCHLKGFRHGSKMESEEKKYRQFFKIKSSNF